MNTPPHKAEAESPIQILEVTAEQVRPLRHAVLRSHQPYEATDYAIDHDVARQPRHFALDKDDARLAIVSTYLEDLESPPTSPARRIRGMAVTHALQGQGYGQLLLNHVVDVARQEGLKWLWCYARTTAQGFYEKGGFEVISDVWEMPGIGPHVTMRCRLS